VGRVGVAARPAQLSGLGASLPALALTAAASGFTALVAVVATGGALRFLCACVISFALVMLALARPAAGVAATLAYLIVLAFVRRLLIEKAAWQQGDPLLLVAPLVASVLLVKLFVLERRRLAEDWISRLVLALFLLTLLQTANPAAGLAAGLAGLLFMAVPLMWFFVGREVLTDRGGERVLQVVALLGTGAAVYGLLQTELGFPSWDQEWLAFASDYRSLNVGDVIRAFGTFSSFGEYATFTSAAFVCAVAFVLRGRTVALLALPVLGVALFLASSRTAVLTAVLATVVMVAIRPRRPALAAAVTFAAIGLTAGAVAFFGSALSATAAGSGSDLVSHQVGGFADPLDPNSSTLLIHIDMVKQGVETSIAHPLGLGTGSANLASGLSGNKDNPGSTDIDISNEFVALGPVGGGLYVALMLLVLTVAVRTYFRGNNLALPVIGVLIVALGQWLNGGFYALSPLVWLLVGWLAAAAVRSQPDPSGASGNPDLSWPR
jgi:O-Antigen ligase